MTIEQKLEKRIKTIIQLTGEYPKEMKITKEEYEKLSIKDDKFMNIKLKIMGEKYV